MHNGHGCASPSHALPRTHPLGPCSSGVHGAAASHYELYGERDSGTNFLSALIELNFNVSRSEHWFKHVYMDPDRWASLAHQMVAAPGAHVGVLLIVRNPADWLQAMYVNLHESRRMRCTRARGRAELRPISAGGELDQHGG